MIVHHTGVERKWAYDRHLHVGKLDQALDEATAKGWTIVRHEGRLAMIFPKQRSGRLFRELPNAITHADGRQQRSTSFSLDPIGPLCPIGLMESQPASEGFIPEHGGYQTLLSYQKARIVYDGTVWFCKRFLDPRSRTVDEMVQAARSGKQNIVEGSQVSGLPKRRSSSSSMWPARA